MKTKQMSSKAFSEMYGNMVPIRSYSGRVGCMCGCRGEYREGTTKATRAMNRLLNTRDVVSVDINNDGNLFCVFHETDTRNNVVFFTD